MSATARALAELFATSARVAQANQSRVLWGVRACLCLSALLIAASVAAATAGESAPPAAAKSVVTTVTSQAGVAAVDVPTVGIVALQSDFGLQDHAVAAMHGVILGVDKHLIVQDLTHGITAYDVWQAAYRLRAVIEYWPTGSVLVSIVDPGVGTERRSVVALTRSGHYIVTPDNGTLTLIADQIGITQLREIDERVNRRIGSEHSHTFHGRDVYAYTAARLAAGVIRFDQVGPVIASPTRLPYEHARRDGANMLGTIPVLDVQWGNVWTNIDRGMFESLGVRLGQKVAITISQGDKIVWRGVAPYARTFGEVPQGAPLVYVNSLDQMAVALNQDDFAKRNGVASGNTWHIRLAPTN